MEDNFCIALFSTRSELTALYIITQHMSTAILTKNYGWKAARPRLSINLPRFVWNTSKLLPRTPLENIQTKRKKQNNRRKHSKRQKQQTTQTNKDGMPFKLLPKPPSYSV